VLGYFHAIAAAASYLMALVFKPGFPTLLKFPVKHRE
jgi:hypothetical protein